MDLGNFDVVSSANEGQVMTILDPLSFEPLLDDEGQPMWIQLAGVDSTVYQGFTRSTQNRRLQFAQERGRISLTAEELEAEALARLAKCTLAWHVQIHHQVPPCTETEAKKLYRAIPWLYDQANRFIHDRSHFLSSKPLSSTTQNGNSGM